MFLKIAIIINVVHRLRLGVFGSRLGLRLGIFGSRLGLRLELSAFRAYALH
jgi:hypothetical protein